MKGLFIVLLVTFSLSVALSLKRSSHSEAPGTANIPNADITDLYAFRSYETGRENYVTFLLNAYPLQTPYGGPNYYSLSTEHFYELYIDSDNDGREDHTFQWIYGNSLPSSGPKGFPLLFPEELQNQPFYTFNNTPTPPPNAINTGIALNISTASAASQAVAIALKVAGLITAPGGSLGNINWEEYYSLNYLRGPLDNVQNTVSIQSTSGDTVFSKPFDYAGEFSFGTVKSGLYETYARSKIVTLSLDSSVATCQSSDQGKVWVGQRSDPFWISLGRIFDYLNLIPVNVAPFTTLGYTIAQCLTNNDLREKNVDIFALEIPIDCVNETGIIYVWAGTRKLYHSADYQDDSTNFDSNSHTAGPQVSRMGNPLVNELVIGLIDKDRFSRQHPLFDADPVIGFGNYVFYPTLPAIISGRYLSAVNSVLGATLTNLAPSNDPAIRLDLVLTFLQGIPGLNQAKNKGNVFTGEVMRLNLNIAPVAGDSQDSLGVVGTFLSGRLTDLAGFPNGRRPGDDVVDIALDVMMGALCTQQFVSHGFVLCSTNTTFPIGGLYLTDGAPVQASNFDYFFPYATTPTPGSYMDGAAGNVVQNVSVCYTASQHGRCPACSGGVAASSSSTPVNGDGGNNNGCSGASRIGGLFMSLLNLF